MRRVVLGVGLALVAGAAVAAQSVQINGTDATVDEPVVHLRGLDTLDGTAEDIDMRVGDSVRFGYLEIAAETCRVPRGDETGDAYAFLQIRDVREANPRFSGWMFASSPALSALDHPRYDVWVVSCSKS